MSSEPAIRVEHVSKKFARSLKKAMLYGLADIARIALLPRRFRSPNLAARQADARRESNGSPMPEASTPNKLHPSSFIPHPPAEGLRPSEFWALRDISFDVRPGECVGIIGHNGAGKSTLFSVLSGIYGPTIGHVEIRGRLQALIALGAGFHPLLSGRENIYINAAILGMKTREINALLGQIIDFSELQDFIDAPVKNYSSGMLVRLGFSVAAHMNPDVLLVDEVLAVGDMAFQRKCLEFMQSLFARKVAVVLVSHNMASIEAVASRVLWLDHGRLRMDEEPKRVIAAYTASQLEKAADIKRREGGLGSEIGGHEYVNIQVLRTIRLDGTPEQSFKHREPFAVEIAFNARRKIVRPYFHLVFSSGPIRVFDASMLADGRAPESIEGVGVLRCLIPHPVLMPNVYTVRLAIRSESATQDVYTEVKSATFTVTPSLSSGAGPCAVSLQALGSLVSQDYAWHWHSGLNGGKHS